MKRREFVKLITVSVAGLSFGPKIFALSPEKRPDIWRRYLTPDLIKKTGGFEGVRIPENDFDPSGSWQHHWRLWLMNRGDEPNDSGYITINRNPGPSNQVSYGLEQHLLESAWIHSTKASIAADKDVVSSSMKWRFETALFDLRENRHVEEGWTRQKGTTEDSHNPDQHLASSFTVLDTIQQMSRKKIRRVEFTLLDELDKEKRNHVVEYAGQTSIPFGEEQADVTRYVETGDGMLPWEYYVDRMGRVLLAISGLRAYILDDRSVDLFRDQVNKVQFPRSDYTSSAKQIQRKASHDRPNFLFITTDQQHWETISALTSNKVNTPNMDRLVRSGVSFSKSYSTNPVSSPARSSLYAGRMTCETGVIDNGLPITAGIPTIGDVLREEGYDTVYTGKWHMPHSFPNKIDGYRVLPGGDGGKGTYGDQVTSRAAAGYLRNRSVTKPFFLAVNFLQPHDVCNWISRNKGYDALRDFSMLNTEQFPSLPENFHAILKTPQNMRIPTASNWSKIQWRYYIWSYLRMVEEVDAEIGRVLDALEETGQKDHTVIIFTSDHGEGMAEHQGVLKNYFYDSACRVPFIVSYPPESKGGWLDETHLVSGVDVMTTICDYAGIRPPEHTRGMSLRPLVKGDNPEWRDFVVSELESDTGRMIRSDDYKLIAFRDDPHLLFFDMKNDPGETRNLANDERYRDLVNRHIEMLESWEAQMKRAPNAKGAFRVTRS